MVSNYWEECYSCNEGNSLWTLKKPFRPVLTGKGLVWGRGSSRSILCNNEKGGKERWWKPSFRISRVPFPHQIHCLRGSRDCVEKNPTGKKTFSPCSSWISTLKRVAIFFLNHVLFFPGTFISNSIIGGWWTCFPSSDPQGILSLFDFSGLEGLVCWVQVVCSLPSFSSKLC